MLSGKQRRHIGTLRRMLAWKEERIEVLVLDGAQTGALDHTKAEAEALRFALDTINAVEGTPGRLVFVGDGDYLVRESDREDAR